MIVDSTFQALAVCKLYHVLQAEDFQSPAVKGSRPGTSASGLSTPATGVRKTSCKRVETEADATQPSSPTSPRTTQEAWQSDRHLAMPWIASLSAPSTSPTGGSRVSSGAGTFLKSPRMRSPDSSTAPGILKPPFGTPLASTGSLTGANASVVKGASTGVMTANLNQPGHISSDPVPLRSSGPTLECLTMQASLPTAVAETSGTGAPVVGDQQQQHTQTGTDSTEAYRSSHPLVPSTHTPAAGCTPKHASALPEQLSRSHAPPEPSSQPVSSHAALLSSVQTRDTSNSSATTARAHIVAASFQPAPSLRAQHPVEAHSMQNNTSHQSQHSSNVRSAQTVTGAEAHSITPPNSADISLALALDTRHTNPLHTYPRIPLEQNATLAQHAILASPVPVSEKLAVLSASSTSKDQMQVYSDSPRAVTASPPAQHLHSIPSWKQATAQHDDHSTHFPTEARTGGTEVDDISFFQSGGFTGSDFYQDSHTHAAPETSESRSKNSQSAGCPQSTSGYGHQDVSTPCLPFLFGVS